MQLVTDVPGHVSATDEVMAKGMAEVLHRHYPGYLWGVNIGGGVVNVLNLSLSGKWGFTIKLPGQYSASDFDRQVMRAGGELLERYRLARGRFDNDRHAELKTDFAGNLTHE